MKQHISTLPNGLEVLTLEKPYTNTVVIGYTVKTGSYYEKGFPRGIAHFTEHMFFKGTSQLSNIEINRKSTTMGAEFNAFTDYEQTKYYIVVPKIYWKEAFSLLNEIMWNAAFPEKEMELEKKVVIDEISMYQDNSLPYVMDIIHTALNENNPNRLNILGTEESVSSITMDDLLSFVHTFYQPNNMNLVVSGDVSHKEVLETVSSISMRESGLSIPMIEPFVPSSFPEDIIIEEEGMEQGFYAFALYGPSVHAEDVTSFDVLSVLLGGNESSRLYQIIREEKGYAYQLGVHSEYYSDSGYLYGYVGTNPENLQDIQKIIKDQLLDIAQNGVTADELNRTLSFLKGRFLLDLDLATAMNDYISESLIYGEDPSPDEYLKSLDTVTPEKIQAIASKFIKEENILSLFYLPVEVEEEVETPV